MPDSELDGKGKHMIWGRDESEWLELAAVTPGFLGERAKMNRLTSYTELNAVLVRRTGAKPFDFSSDRDRAAVGALLGQVAREHQNDVGALLSAIVIHLNGNDAGTGFYRLAVDLGLLAPTTTADQRLAFWSGQVRSTLSTHAMGGAGD